jgi:hypothetical protein
MATAIVRRPDGSEIERHTRGNARRVWLTVQGQAAYSVAVEGGIEQRRRYPVGATVEIDGARWATLRADGWELESSPGVAEAL